MTSEGHDVDQLPKYSGDQSKCPACGWLDADTLFVASAKTANDYLSDERRGLGQLGTAGPGSGAFLLRVCRRCLFRWAERTCCNG